MLHGERHNLHVEAIRPESRNGKADAVDGNGTLGDEERRELRGKADCQPVKVQIDAQLLDVPDGIHVSLDEVTAEPAVGAQRPLQVHVAAARQAPERGDANGFRSDVRVKLLTFRKDHGQTHAVHRDAVSGRELRRQRRRNAQPAPAARGFALDELAHRFNEACEHIPRSEYRAQVVRRADRTSRPCRKPSPAENSRRHVRLRAA